MNTVTAVRDGEQTIDFGPTCGTFLEMFQLHWGLAHAIVKATVLSHVDGLYSAQQDPRILLHLQ